MKKIIGIMLAVWLIAALYAAAASADTAKLLLGDSDGSGEVNILDATAVQRKLGELHVQAFNENAADINADGVDITDATYIRRYSAKIETPYPIGEYISNDRHDEYELPLIPK